MLDNRLLRLQTARFFFTETSRVCAEIEQDETLYTVEAAYDERAPEHCSVLVYFGGRLLSAEERTATFQTSVEEEECSYFINRYDDCSCVSFAELDFTKKIAGYRQSLSEENRQELSARTDGIGRTHTFRRGLKKYCTEFLPIPLRIEKGLWLTMDKGGCFSVKGEQPHRDLSATEDMLLQYLCFLETNRFWGELQKELGRTVQKPLLIGALADRIDFCIDLTLLLEQALALGRQAFVFTWDKDIENRIQERKRMKTILT